MSTSSGRDGSCIYCGHWLNAHTKVKYTKCKKKGCNAHKEICQAGTHGNSTAYMICDHGCGHGWEYWPDMAKSAIDLPEKCWADSHPRKIFAVADDQDVDATQLKQIARNRTFSAESMDPLVAPGESSQTPANTFVGFAGDYRLISDLDEDELLGVTEGVDELDLSDPVGGSKTSAKRPDSKKGKQKAPPSDWAKISNVDDNWKVFDTEKRKLRQVYQEKGEWFVIKKDKSRVYLQ